MRYTAQEIRIEKVISYISRMRAFVLILALLLASSACTADTAEAPSDRLIGSWQTTTTIGDSAPCSWGFVLRGDDTYTAAIVCELESGSLGSQVEAGSYVATDDELTLQPEQSTCAGDSGDPVEFSYSFLSGGQLSLGMTRGVIVFEEAERGGSGSGVIVFGCWDDDEGLVRGELLPL